MINITLFQPEIAGNVGSIIRTCACFNSNLHIIEPCGFPFDYNRIKKSALDYIEKVAIFRHSSFDEFQKYRTTNYPNSRLIVASTKSSKNLYEFNFRINDFIIFGKESAGLPKEIHNTADERILIKMSNDLRSLNLAVSSSIFLAKACHDLEISD